MRLLATVGTQFLWRGNLIALPLGRLCHSAHRHDGEVLLDSPMNWATTIFEPPCACHLQPFPLVILRPALVSAHSFVLPQMPTAIVVRPFRVAHETRASRYICQCLLRDERIPSFTILCFCAGDCFVPINRDSQCQRREGLFASRDTNVIFLSLWPFRRSFTSWSKNMVRADGGQTGTLSMCS